MSQIIVLQSHSEAAEWLFCLKINKAQNRISSCVNKIGRLYKLSQSADIGAILGVYKCYCEIRKVEAYFDKEIARLEKLIRSKVKDKYEYEPFPHSAVRLRVANPIQTAFYHILKKFDRLMCLCETCVSLSIFKKQRVFVIKTKQYKRTVLRLVTVISQLNPDLKKPLDTLRPDECEILMMALHSEVMPQLPDPIIRVIETHIKKTSSITKDVKGQAA